MTFKERFWGNVDRGEPDECWPWKRSRKEKGYGQVRQGQRNRRTHVVAWELTNGIVPSGLLVCHRCDNPPCCNPRHLFTGSAADNTADMLAKGRGAKPGPGRWEKGHRPPKAKLCAEDVRRIRELGVAGWSQRRIAQEVGVHQSQVSRTLTGVQWAQII